MTIISPIAIDMGAKNTGVYLNHFEQGEDPTTSGNIEGNTIVIDSKRITWSQAGRTQKRHQVRSNKRRKLAKRLLRCILTDAAGYGLTIEKKQMERLMGLLNRRGYNRITITPEQEEILDKREIGEFFHPLIFNGESPSGSLLAELSNKVVVKNEEDENRWKSVLENKIFSLSGRGNKGFKDYVRKEAHDIQADINDLSSAFTTIKEFIQTQVDNYATGHLPREKYLNNIRQDIDKDILLESLFNDNLTKEKLARLIGHISNLQLRILRKYFNDKCMKSGDKWLPEKFHLFFFRWVRSWHCKQDKEKENWKKLLSRTRENILDVFTALDPELSIPPYEDQNNRRPPKDLTLRLKPRGLDRNFPKWECVTELLAENYCLPNGDQISIQKGLQSNVRVQTAKNKDRTPPDTSQRQILADTLHRILDRSSVLDPYRIRLQVQFRHSDFSGNLYPGDRNSKLSDKDSEFKAVIEDAYALLKKHIGEENVVGFVQLARDYFDEVEIAKQGLWSDSEENLFFRCNTNPPHKNKIQHHLVSHILGENLDETSLEKFIDECWGEKIGRSTIKGIAKNAEDERKIYGNSFKRLLERQIWLDKHERELDTNEKQGVDGEKILKIHRDCEKAAEEIAKHFGHNDKKKKIYANVFSFSQLYNILETQIKGFSKTDKWNTIENSWRSRKENFDDNDEPVANAVRLVADSIRPFDGMLDRIISRQAFEISQQKIRQIEAIGIDENEELFIPIFMEQNRFKFEQDMHDIKGIKNVKKRTRERIKQGLERQEQQWKDKDQRIKGNSICPYNGKKIGTGEMDHIIPQSQSRKHGDVVFNSEANLIYCSSNGNHIKGDHRYTFDNLHRDYLKEIFCTTDTQQIQQDIEDFVNQLDPKDFSGFHNLEEKEQMYLRHALFMSELDSKTFSLLNTRFRNLVNGTQGYMGKQIRKLLQQKYPNVRVQTYQVSPYEVSQLRTTLGSFDKALEKNQGSKQGSFSHVIDAALVLAAALKKEEVASELRTTNVSGLSETGKWLKDLLPEKHECDVQELERRPKYRKDLDSTQIFKEGLYGEKFIPILLDGEKIYYGFSLDNCIEIKRKAEICFETLKPFLYFGRKNNKQPVTDGLSYWQKRAKQSQRQYIYLTVDKEKALEHLQKCAQKECDDLAVKQAIELKGLRYSVEKKEIRKVLIENKQGQKTFIKSLDEVKLEINNSIVLPAKADWERVISHPITNYCENPTTLKNCFGKSEQIEIDNKDMAGFWEELSEKSGLDKNTLQKELLKINLKTKERVSPDTIIPEGVLKDKLKKDKKLEILKDSNRLKESFGVSFKKKVDRIPAESWESLFEDIFHTNKVKNRHNHRKVRKDYSLPVVSAPSGGFRIKRRNPLTDESVYQVSAIAGGYACGFTKDADGKIDMSKDGVTFNPKLKASRNVAYIGKGRKPYIRRKQDSDNVELFGTCRKVELNCKNISDSSLTLVAKERITIDITITKGVFDQIIEYGNDIDPNQPEISIVFKKDEEKEKHDDFKKYWRNTIFACDVSSNKSVGLLPRCGGNGKWIYKLGVRVLGDGNVKLQYKTDLSRELKTAYQKDT